jgi:acyl-CoA reductase-like NAD-dependent aldehyde dehydrogenase
MFRLLIDGQLREGAEPLQVIDPSTGESFATCARADRRQLEEAIAAAKRAFPRWSRLAHDRRRGCLQELADQLDARADEFCRLLVREQGKPLAEARFEILGSAAALRYYSERELPLVVVRQTEQETVLEQRTPLGVVAAIMPWNFPLLLFVTKLAPALITGNTVVAKPAPTTPLTTALFGELAAQVLPPGVLNIVVDLNDLGAALTSHPDVVKVSFTGSTATGRRVMQSGADSLKRLTLELGGNDPAIVLDDVEVGPVAARIFEAAMMNAGQVCLAVKRVYAPRALYDRFCDELANLAKRAVVGNGLDPRTQIGPVQNRRQYERVLALIEDARPRGTVIAGGGPIEGAGFFIHPTVIRDLPEEARLVREEQFGPVIPVLAYDDLEEALERANNTEYGLGATIWTGNPHRGLQLAKRVDSGIVWVNRHLEIPFDIASGGAKQSGIGRQQGLEGMKEYTQAKVLSVAHAPIQGRVAAG